MPPFQPGNTLGKGRPKGSHNKITKQTEDMLAKLTGGPKAFKSLEALRDKQPAVFWRIVASLLPKQVEAAVNHSSGVSFRMFMPGEADNEQPGVPRRPAGEVVDASNTEATDGVH